MLLKHTNARHPSTEKIRWRRWRVEEPGPLPSRRRVVPHEASFVNGLSPYKVIPNSVADEFADGVDLQFVHAVAPMSHDCMQADL